MSSPRTGSPNIHLEPPTAQTSPSTTAAASPSASLASFITKPSKSNATMALAGNATTPSPSSSRAQSLHSSVSHQSNLTFTASDAARHLSQEHVTRTSQEMFRKIADYIKSEMLSMSNKQLKAVSDNRSCLDTTTGVSY